MPRVTLIPGDGIGPEVIQSAQDVIAAAGLDISWEVFPAGQTALDRGLDPVPPDLLESIRRNGLALKGPVTTPVGEGFTSVNVRLRQELDLYGNLRPVRSLPGIDSPYSGINLLVVRENTEELYTGIEFWAGNDAAVAPRLITRGASERIARLAFAEAHRQGATRVTVGHKANILKLTDGLFRDSCRTVAREHPDLELQELLVDNLCLQLVRRPQDFEVLVLPNLYGDLISDLTAGLTGGLGLAVGTNVGDELKLFEAVHGSAPRLAGSGKANPAATIMAGMHLVESLGEENAAQRIQSALYEVLANRDLHTPDLGGKNTTEGFTRAVCRALER